MGHYASEMAGYDSGPEHSTEYYLEQEAQKQRDIAKINEFWDAKYVGTDSSCPRCGASLKWNYGNLKNAVIHIDWHEELRKRLKEGRVHPGDKI